MDQITASKMANMRKRTSHVCLICAKKFIAIKQAKTCGNACRCELYRKNKENDRIR